MTADDNDVHRERRLIGNRREIRDVLEMRVARQKYATTFKCGSGNPDVIGRDWRSGLFQACKELCVERPVRLVTGFPDLCVRRSADAILARYSSTSASIVVPRRVAYAWASRATAGGTVNVNGMSSSFAVQRLIV